MVVDILKTFKFELNLRSLTLDDEWKPVAFKEDGQRFEHSNSTVKLCCDQKYVVGIKIDSDYSLDWMWMDIQNIKSNSQLSPIVATYAPTYLIGSNNNDYQYTALWNTNGLAPNKKGDRHVVNFFFQGSKVNVTKQLQCKFYSKDDWHADYGHRCGGIGFECSLSADGDVAIKNERFKLAKNQGLRKKNYRANTI